MKRSLRLALLVGLVVALVGGAALAQEAAPPAATPLPSTSPAETPAAGVPASVAATAAEAPLTNADVVKLCKLDLGDEVVIAKINQAKVVDFKLDTDSLVALKQEGASKDVIAAMLKRTTAGGGAGSGSPGLAGAAGTGGVPTNEGVWLRTPSGEVAMRSVQGDFSTTYAFVTVLFFLDFPGLHADFRITDPRPTVVVRSTKDLRGRVFLVKAESNKKDKTRSVKVGKASPFGMKSWSSPDSDWTVECDVKELQPGLWEMTPKKDLKKGEYGVLFRGGFLGNLGAEQGELFDFGVD